MIWLAGAALVAGLVVALFKVFMYAALASSPLSSFAGELGQNVGKSVLKSYAAVCLEGTVISGMEGPPPPENRVIDAVLSQEKKKEMEK